MQSVEGQIDNKIGAIGYITALDTNKYTHCVKVVLSNKHLNVS